MTGALNLVSLARALSHDLRAPPRRVEAFATLLRETLAPDPGSETLRMLDSIETNARETSRMLTELLGLVELAMAPMSPGPVDLDKGFHVAWSNLQAAGATGSCVLRLNPLPAVQGDRALLQQVIDQLLSNALKFSARHEHPCIDVAGIDEDGEVRINVKDNGAGFDEKYVDRLFRPFSRLHANREFEGRGMGLAIVDLIVRKHGGRVSARSSPAAGTTFNFALPCEDAR